MTPQVENGKARRGYPLEGVWKTQCLMALNFKERRMFVRRETRKNRT